jgi:hypothetical protein
MIVEILIGCIALVLFLSLLRTEYWMSRTHKMINPAMFVTREEFEELRDSLHHVTAMDLNSLYPASNLHFPEVQLRFLERHPQ